MSHLLTRLVERALGTASSIGPVRSPVFIGQLSGYGETAEPGASRFVYGDLVTTSQVPLPQTPEASAGLSDAVAIREEERDVPAAPVQPLGSRVMDALSAPDIDRPSTPNANSQQQGHDVIVSSALVDTRSAQTETMGAELDPRATALSPVAAHASRTIEEQPVSRAGNRHLPSYSLADERGSGPVDIHTEQQTASEPLTQAAPESLLRPRVSPAPSFLSQQASVDKLPRERDNPQASQPTIQVTIGRIEVRAVTTPPPQAPQARKKPQPSLSLDDYLKQRMGAQR